MKTIKILFVTLFISTMFFACETDTVDEQIGLEIEVNDDIRGEDDEGRVEPE